MSAFLWPFAVAALVSLAATAALAALAPHLGWLDWPSSPRKTQARAVPPVGGAALFSGFGLSAALFGWQAPFGLSSSQAILALFLAFLVGTLDDLLPRGLSPLAKLGGQLASALPLAAACAERFADAPLGSLGAFALALLSVVAALNLANTFDHADGALAGIALVGLALAPSPAAAGAVAGFLPLNLNARLAPGERAQGTPSAYLGDAGSHTLGLLLLLTPLAWPVLVLPALDLARLSVARLRAGSRPWIGDRRHLAHRLAGEGRTSGRRSPRRVVLLLVLAAAPAAVCAALAPAVPSVRAPAALFLGAAGYGALLFLARAGERRNGPGEASAPGKAARPCPLPPSAE